VHPSAQRGCGAKLGGVTELLSMLVPLDTLAGWPAAQEPTALQSLALLIGFPALAIVIAFLVAKLGTSVQAKRGTAAPPVDSVWVGGRQAGGEIEAAPEMHGVGAEDDDKTPGGAGARW
jgi:hypothetical protein